MNGSADLIIRGATVITPEAAIENGAVAVAGGKITYAGPASGAPEAEATFEANGYLLPGFVDLHCHGGSGFDVTSGRYDRSSRSFAGGEDDLREAVRVTARTHLNHGTTTLILSTYAAEEGMLLRALAAIGEAAEASDASETGPRVLGANLEGNYLKDPACAGAQSEAFFRHPSTEDFDRLSAAARGRIKLVNVAADYGYPAQDLVRHLITRDVVASCGHTSATWDETKACIDAGTTLAVHFGNGPNSTSFKPPGMALEAMLSDPRVTLELIADGHHVAPGYLLSFLAAKDFRAALVTDAMLPVDAPDITRFTAGDKVGERSPDGDVLRLQGSSNLLFGSLLTTDRAVANVTRWLVEGVHGVYQNAPVIDPPPDTARALTIASRLASGVPAEVMNVHDRLGAIRDGLAADLVLLGEDLSLQKAWFAGREVGADTAPEAPAEAAETEEAQAPPADG